jgi:DNA modification methylase
MHVEDWPLDRIIPYTGNPRKRSKKAVAKVAASIREFGPRQPIVVDEDGVILVGHTRRDAAASLGMATFPVHQALGLTEAQKIAYRIADNRTNEETEWDDDLLKIELKALDDFKLDLSLTGFDLRQVAGYLRTGPQAGEDDVPEVAELVTKPGDLWLLGEHRLLCGDCTNAESVAAVLDGAKPRLMVSDPPYGVSLDSEWRDRAGINKVGPAEPSYMKHRIEGHTETTISGDTRADWSDAFALVPSLEVLYVWHATSHMVEVAQGIERIGFKLRQQLIWFKTTAAISRSAYHWQHEPCLYAVRKGKTANWQGTRDQTTVWSAASPKMIMGGSTEDKENHPTQKPVELMRRPLLNHTVKGDAVYDPFLGSGTTLIACETEGRRCYGLEIEPKYCDVIVARWEKFTGKKAVRHSEVAV